jgi:hypothetical protein
MILAQILSLYRHNLSYTITLLFGSKSFFPIDEAYLVPFEKALIRFAFYDERGRGGAMLCEGKCSD